MSAPASSLTLPAPLDRQKAALIKLLADDDPAVYKAIRSKILSFGNSARDWLRPHTRSNDGLLRSRVREIVNYLGRQAADNEFLAFCLNQGEDFDLEQAVFLLARTQHPETNVAAYQALLDQFAAELLDRADLTASPEAILTAVNQYLYQALKFIGNEQNYYDPDNSYLNRVIDRRTGNPISLCLIYLFISRRLHMPITGIGMPGHFLLRFQSTTSEIYIDAFNKGKLLTKAKCVKFLVQTSGFQESYLAPVSPRRILLRICSNLHQIYVQMEAAEGISRLQRYIIALAK